MNDTALIRRYETALRNIANYGDLSTGPMSKHPNRAMMVELSGYDCAEIAREALDTAGLSIHDPDHLNPAKGGNQPADDYW